LSAASPTIPQPFYPGVGANAETIDPDSLDPGFKPDRTDNFTLTLQRELNQHIQVEVGYIGKILRNEFMEVNLDAVPTMETLGGQSFASAYGQLYQQLIFSGMSAASVSAQPFFENALGGTKSAFCSGYSSCTAAVASNYASLIKETAVSDLWSKMAAAPGWVLGRTIFSQPVPGGTVGQSTSIGTNTSLGWGNYNAVFVSMHTRDWHGLTANSNFTYGRALGTATILQLNSSATALNPYDIGGNYGPQAFDVKFQYNLALYYAEPFFRGQRGLLGHILGGWTISPLFTAQSGFGTAASYSEGNCTGCEAFGEVTTPGTSAFSSVAEDAVGFGPYTGGSSALYNVAGTTGTNVAFGSNGVGTRTSTPYLQMFANPGQVYSELRPCVLGFDTSCGGYYNLRNLPTWNLDATVVKDLGIYKERLGAQFFFTFTNLLNHFQPGTPSLSLTTPTSFGQITSQANNPRALEFGLRIHF
jgi:hypothetical protein